MSRRGTRFVRIVAVVAVLAGVVAATAAALAFDDAVPCQDTQPLFVCPEGVVDASYSIQFVGRGGCGPDPPNAGLPYQYRVLNGALPPGLSLSKSGVISGQPTNAGTWQFWVELSDEDPPSQSWCVVPAKAQREFTINILPRLRVTDQVPGPATVGAPYSLGLVAVMQSGPDATSPPSSPVTWTVQVGTLPPGLTLGADGVISGTPTTIGSYSFTVRAVLDPTRSDTKAHTINVKAPVAIAAPGLVPRSEVGVPFRLPLSATGGAGTYTWSLSSGALPSGLVLDPASGAISGTPRAAGAFAFTATAADTEARTAGYSGTIAVASRLAISTLRLRPGKVGRLYRAKLKTRGGVPPTKWRRVGGPPPRGLHFDRTLGVLSGTPRREGRYRMTFVATDGLKVKATKTFVIDVLRRKRP